MREYFLETERIVFSRWTEDDTELANSLWGEAAVSKYITKTGRFSEREIIRRLKTEINNEEQFGMQYWPIFEKATGSFIGCCGMDPYDTEKREYGLGYHLKRRYWGRGFATEAARAAVAYAFEQLGAVLLFAGHHPDNLGSKKVIEKLGFQYVGDEFYEPTGQCHPTYERVK